MGSLCSTLEGKNRGTENRDGGCPALLVGEQVLKLLGPLWGCQAHQGSVLCRIRWQVDPRELGSKGREEDRAVQLTASQLTAIWFPPVRLQTST